MRRLAPALLCAAAATLAVASPAAAKARLVPIDPRIITVWAMNDDGWVAGLILPPTTPMDAAPSSSSLALWRNGPLVRLPQPPGDILTGPAVFSGDGSRLVARALSSIRPPCSRVDYPVVFSLSRADAVRTILDPLPGNCVATPAGFAGDQVVGVAERIETIQGLVDLGVSNDIFGAQRTMRRAVRWPVTGGVPELVGTIPPPVVRGTDARTAEAVTTHTRAVAGNSDGDVLFQTSSMTWQPEQLDWTPTIPLPTAAILRGGTSIALPNVSLVSDGKNAPGTLPSGAVVLGDGGQVAIAPRSYWTSAGGLIQLPFTAGIVGMSPNGRVVGLDLVQVPGGFQALEARSWYAGRVTDVAAIARSADAAHADWYFRADGPINRKNSVVLHGCPPQAYQAGGRGESDPACQHFRLDQIAQIVGQAVVPAAPVLGPAGRAARPAAGVTIVATDGSSTVRTTTGKDGRFALDVSAGTWRVSVSGRGGCLAQGKGACRASLTVQSDGSADVTLAARVDPTGAAAATAGKRVAVRRGAAPLRVTCRRVLGCTGTVALRAAKGTTPYGSKRVALRYGTQTVRVPLAAPAKRALAGAASVGARVSFKPGKGKAVQLGKVTLVG